MLDLLYNLFENNQPVFTNSQIKTEKNKRAPLFDASGFALIKESNKQKEVNWRPFNAEKSRKSGKKSRKKRKNNKVIINHRYNKKSRAIKEIEISSFNYRPTNWDKDYRIVVKRTLIQEDNNQQYLDESLCKNQYYIGKLELVEIALKM